MTGPIFRNYLKRTIIGAASCSQDKIAAATEAIQTVFSFLEKRINTMKKEEDYERQVAKLQEGRLIR